MYQLSDVARMCRLDHVTHQHYRCHAQINPRRIVPIGPILDFTSAHGRGAPIAID